MKKRFTIKLNTVGMNGRLLNYNGSFGGGGEPVPPEDIRDAILLSGGRGAVLLSNGRYLKYNETPAISRTNTK